jgi:hypothetical protein
MTNKEYHNFTFRLDNKGRANIFFLLFIASGIIFCGIAFYLISRESAVPLIIEVLIAIAFFVILSKIKPSYFEFVVFQNHFTINYYPVASVAREYQSVEVPLSDFSHFSITQSVFGLKKEIVVSVRTPYGIADYPPISISILKKKERERLQLVLNKLIPTKPDV